MDKAKYYEDIEFMFEKLEGIISQGLIDFREGFFAYKDFNPAPKNTNCPTIGWKNFLTKFYAQFGIHPYEGFIFNIENKLNLHVNAIKKNATELAQMEFMNVKLEKGTHGKHAWWGTLQITEKGEKIAKELL